MAASFLHDHPVLRPFLLENVRLTGTTIGAGAYGSVEEVEIPGAKCAAKKIHPFFQDPTQMPEAGIQKASCEFVQECQLMSTLRHPHIVQFLGVCFLPGSRLPALVMERLLTSLHEILDPERPPETKPYIPVALKCSVLHDVARGLSFLHSHSPPIIHRDLSARNVLLNSGMLAKIADLGVARIVPSLRAATMSKAPGASIYMPPEALEDESRYDITIDIFSLGVLAIFTLSQTFPKPLSAAYMDARRMMVGRTELERRGNYMQQIHRLLREGHPLIQMIQRCLKNLPEDRPTIHAVLAFLEQARAEVQDGECDMSKLELVQTLRQKTQLIQAKDERIERREGENRSLSQQLSGKDQVIRSKDNEIESRDDEIRSKDDEIQRLQSSLQALQVENQGLRRQMESESSDQTARQSLDQTATATTSTHPKPVKQPKASRPATTSAHPQPVKQPKVKQPKASRPARAPASTSTSPTQQPKTSAPTVQRQPLKWPLPLQWRRGRDVITHGSTIYQRHIVLLNGMVYVRGSNGITDYIVQRYSPESGEWSKLPRASVCAFAMTSLNGQLVLVGSHMRRAGKNKITVWDSGRGDWAHPYPPMPTGRSMSAAVGYQNYLIVACGFIDIDTVEVLNSSSGRWYSAQPLPVGGHTMSSVVVGDHWYLSSFGCWKDGKRHIFWAHLPTLISSATSAAHVNAASIWQELPTPPVDGPALLALQGHLLLVGGRGRVQKLHRYDPEARQWRECGQLPVGMACPSCAVLPSGELMVAGGEVKDIGYSYQMWLGKIEC